MLHFKKAHWLIMADFIKCFIVINETCTLWLISKHLGQYVKRKGLLYHLTTVVQIQLLYNKSKYN